VRHPGDLKVSAGGRCRAQRGAAARCASLAGPSGWVVDDKRTRHGEERGINWLTDGACGKEFPEFS
jgi:hypothetical protein